MLHKYYPRKTDFCGRVSV